MARKRQSIAAQVLGFIQASPTGRTFTEIQRFAWVIAKFDGDGDWATRSGAVMPRGWWCHPLCGNGFTKTNRYGLLRTFCTKDKDGRWYRNGYAYCNAPYTVMRQYCEARAIFG